MQHLKHCIVLSFFGSTHKLASLYWAQPGYVYTSLCTGVLSHTHYELGTTHIHTNTGKKMTFIGMACKSLPMINLRNTFM